ncbi:hypothetical protein JVT61DRAFT_9266 [Boletus reticuloceps]|uniref:Uncharacterized protein n=1 Tax=Boletus reticuloceps TaxID=495285 RepID=A0A8I2YG84_9AGAM|nr:hypothetical protein JVT61DRAFT_9266 [Boletus reticuloceps]
MYKSGRRTAVQRAVAHIERQWKQSLESDTDVSANATAEAEPSHLDPHPTSTTPNVATIRNETLSSIFRSIFNIRSNKSQPSQIVSPPSTDTTPPPETLTESSTIEPSLPPGQFDMRPFGFELIFDFRWSRRP